MTTTPVPPAAVLELLPGDVEESLRETVRALLAARCLPEAVTAVYDGDRSLVGPLWQALAGELGLSGLLVPEELGGAGATAREAAVVLEELGRAVAPVPFLTSAVLATTAVLPTGDAELLGKLAEGSLTAALVVPLTAHADDLPVVGQGADGTLVGRVASVAGALEADALLVPVGGPGGGVALHLVEATAARVEPVVSLDMTRQVADVLLDGVSSRVLLHDAGEAVRHALRVGAALLAAEQVGVAARCLEDTVAYLKQRRQFGRVLAGYQALKHRFADLLVEVESARAAASYAVAAAAEGDPDLPVAAAVAQVYCSDVAVHAAEERIQLHGGIGMTWEHPSHLYLKRAKADQLALGTPGRLLGPLGERVGLPSTG